MMVIAKNKLPVFEDQINAKIQRKFDMVFGDNPTTNVLLSNENSNNKLNDTQNFDVDEMVMERNDGSNKNSNIKPKIGLDLTNENEGSPIPVEKTLFDDDDLNFSLDFDVNLEKSDSATHSNTKASVSVAEISNEDNYTGFTIDDSDIGDVDDSGDTTQKTILFKPSMLAKPTPENLPLEKTGNTNMSIDMMSTEEAKANIESTIKEILRPDLESSMFDLSKNHTDLNDVEDSILDLGTPSKSFSISDIDDGTFVLDKNSDSSEKSSIIDEEKNDDFELNNSESTKYDATMDFDLVALTASAMSQTRSGNEDVSSKYSELDLSEAQVKTPEKLVEVKTEAVSPIDMPVSSLGGTGLNAEDSMRFQATLRALREEREEMLLQIKNAKGDSKELEQDNLTLKANLDEAKIEITILRKRHMLEIEDLKYRVSLSEEKKAMADEKTKQADMRREKLEQKVRIDFNQIKQREKELESKLELLSMDIDSQVQSRDQKILELRRKIDALEFNMENASIKEQRSLDDKRKLEDRLNKIMKTLRHSIKNLEDDIDHMEDEGDHQKDKN